MRRLFIVVLAAGVALVPVPSAARNEKKKPAQTQVETALPTVAQIEAALGSQPPRAAVIYDPAHDEILWARRANEERAPASLLKIATALLVSERLEPTDEVVISGRAATAPFDQLQWRRGARFTVDDVMHGMMLSSSNGAAIALAERTAGSLTSFRKLANKRIKAWGATSTNVIDPSGLDAVGQVSTARDLARLSARLLDDPWLATIVRTHEHTVPWPDGGEATFVNLNRYLAQDDTAVGVKNGFTDDAGNAVAAAATRDGRTHIVVVLDSNDVYGVAERLMDLAFTMAPGVAAARVVEPEEPSPEPSASVLGETVTRDEADASVAAAPPQTPVATTSAVAQGMGALTRLAIAAPVMAWGIRLIQIDRRRARRYRRLRAHLRRLAAN